MTVENSQEKTFGMLCHLLALCGLVVPFGNIFGPLVFWLLKRGGSTAVDREGKESLNFQITMTIIIMVLSGMAAVLIFILIGFLLLPVIALASLVNLILVIIAAIQTNNNGSYRYPMTIRFLK